MKRELVLENPRPDGYHLMLEFFGCDTAKIDSLPFLRQAIKTAVQKAGLTNLGSRFHRFQPHGVTGFTLLSQSHISFHTWPEYGYLVLDIFTCGPEEQAQQVAEVLLNRLGPGQVKRQIVRKGYRYQK
ncbi:MAG: adenosylmethionine decarboxylase [Desulfobacca sp.]|uniref:adenosylmethionine decarboxylase n=1 Tax=Desulfobacca sp. TaxID=2067990 RepID=UPI00404A6733